MKCKARPKLEAANLGVMTPSTRAKSQQLSDQAQHETHTMDNEASINASAPAMIYYRQVGSGYEPPHSRLPAPAMIYYGQMGSGYEPPQS